MEPAFEALSDDELRAKTDEFRSRLANGETLQQILPEAFATVREAGKRVLGYASFRCAINRWYGANKPLYRRDAYG